MSWISYFSFTFDYLGNSPFYPSMPQVRQVLSWPVYHQHQWMKSILNILTLILWDRRFFVVVALYMSFTPEAEVSAKARHSLFNESVCRKIQNSFSIISNRNKFYPSNFRKFQQRCYCLTLEAVTLSFYGASLEGFHSSLLVWKLIPSLFLSNIHFKKIHWKWIITDLFSFRALSFLTCKHKFFIILMIISNQNMFCYWLKITTRKFTEGSFQCGVY